MRGLAAGLLAGLIGSAAMSRFSAALQKATRAREPAAGDQGQDGQGESATVRTAQALSQAGFGHELTPEEKAVAGPAVHYAFGALIGGLYGLVAELMPFVTRGRGLLLGTGLWLAADEMALPLLRLSGPPQTYPASTHAAAFGAHAVYGLTTDLVRRIVRLVA